jgi:outer membrane lipoprotein-sorting protein
MKRSPKVLGILLAATSLVLLAAPVSAQQLTADEVLDNIQREAEATEDASFLLTGRLIDPDGTAIALEVEVEVIPGERAARASFIQPDALADNVIVFDDDAVYNYLFLTNQVTVFDADDPDALGGLLGAGEEAEAPSLTLDLEKLFAGWDASVVGYENGAYRLRLDNKEQGATLDHVLATVQEGTWVPTRLVLMGEGDKMVAELFIEDFRRDQGLSVADVTYIPEDAEVIDERD